MMILDLFPSNLQKFKVHECQYVFAKYYDETCLKWEIIPMCYAEKIPAELENNTNKHIEILMKCFLCMK